MKADEATRNAVNSVLNKLAEALKTKDLEAFMKLFANEPNMLTIGLEEKELSVGNHGLKDRMKKTFEEADSISIKYGWTSIKASGDAAWVASNTTYKIKKKGKQEVTIPARMTGVLEKIEGDWLWTQHHLSTPIPIEAPDASPEEEKQAEEAAKEVEKADKEKAGKPAEGVKEEETEKKIDDVFYEIP